jgi:hypothetical protein
VRAISAPKPAEAPVMKTIMMESSIGGSREIVAEMATLLDQPI